LLYNPFAASRKKKTMILADEPTAGIMVTHDLRMCQYVDRVLQTRDSKLVKMGSNRSNYVPH
jgi:energy-coupling factor transporter ATP-binding protein EcfA2